MRWENKVFLIAYILGNIFAKNCCNRTVYVKITASQRWDDFLRHSVVHYVSVCHSFLASYASKRRVSFKRAPLYVTFYVYWLLLFIVGHAPSPCSLGIPFFSIYAGIDSAVAVRQDPWSGGVPQLYIYQLQRAFKWTSRGYNGRRTMNSPATMAPNNRRTQ